MKAVDLCKLVEDAPLPAPIYSQGVVTGVQGGLIKSQLPAAALGSFCAIERGELSALPCRVIGFTRDETALAPLDEPRGIFAGMTVTSMIRPLTIDAGPHLIGSVVDVLGKRLDGPAIPVTATSQPIEGDPPSPLSRPLITQQLLSGIRSIDCCTPLGYGQRIALIAPAGMGKSTLLGALARTAAIDVVVIALVGERGREVNEFLLDALGPQGRSRSVVVVATSDESALRRALAPSTATAIAEYFRDQGLRVLLLVDSLTRTARAIRDLSLAVGEFPVRHGYTPSVYTQLPKLLERAGPAACGSITAIYTLLSAEEGESDPLAEEIKSLLDGHLTLTAELAQRGVYPAIDPLYSQSRLCSRLLSWEQSQQRATVIAILSKLRRDRDIVMLGGTPDNELRAALACETEILNFLRQDLRAIEPRSAAAWLAEIIAGYQRSLTMPSNAQLSNQ